MLVSCSRPSTETKGTQSSSGTEVAMATTLLLFLLLPISLSVPMGMEMCPRECLCEVTELTKLPIHSLLVHAHKSRPDSHPQLSYHQRNEVLDEADEERAPHQLGPEPLLAATCVLTDDSILSLMTSLPINLQVLTLLQGPGPENVTLEGSHFEQLEALEVLEIHGLTNGRGVLWLLSDSLAGLQRLRYLNLQDIRLLAAPSVGNSPRPVLRRSPPLPEDNNVQLLMAQDEEDVVPYKIYQERKELVALSAFSGLHDLVFLRAYRCHIKEVHWEMFDGLHELEYLSLEENQIPFIHDFAFYGTPNLKHLTLAHNKLLDIRSTGFAGLLNLEVLDLSYNNISHLSEASLPPFPQLVTADFHHNPVELIFPNTFLVMNETKHLFISGKENGLLIRPYSFLGLTELIKLSLTDVKVEVLEREYFKGLSKLKELKIEGVVMELSFDAFLEAPKLLELLMKNCSMRRISMDAFFGLYGLLYLDLSFNELESIPPSLFYHQESLKEINLSNNKLTTLPDGLFSEVPAKLIRLDSNPWHCTCTMSDWRPTQINKVKVRIMDNSQCQRRYDKGVNCRVSYTFQYSYDQSVTPRCATPARYSGWSVFHLLRKHLRCHEKKYNTKPHKKRPKMPIIDLNELAKQTQQNIKADYAPENSSYTSKLYEEVEVKPNSSNTKGLQTEELTREITASLQINTERGNTVSRNQSSQNTMETINENTTVVPGELTSLHRPNQVQHMWTQKDKVKYKALLEKEQKLSKQFNSTTVSSKSKGAVPMSIDLTYKMNKKSDAQKKWQNKMENTINQINGIA